MNGWFWRRAFGPLPSTVTGVTDTNGSDGQVMTAKKKAATRARVAVAHGMRSGCARRYRYSSRLDQPVSRNVQNRMLPSSAAHSEMNE